MRRLFFVLFVSALLAVPAFSQAAVPSAETTSVTTEKKKRPPVFRATKAQVKEVQEMLKTRKLYTGGATGSLNDDTRTSIKGFQKDNGLKETGTLNRATLEKMGIELTENQKAIPVSPNSFAAAKTESAFASGESKPKRVIFRATKDQIMEAQKMLKSKGMYAGDETGKLDDDTRTGLKKYQTDNGVKVTGTLNQVTLEKMGIELTDNQKAAAAKK